MTRRRLLEMIAVVAALAWLVAQGVVARAREADIQTWNFEADRVGESPAGRTLHDPNQ